MNAVRFALGVLSLVPTVATGVKGAVEAVQWGRDRLQAMADAGRDPESWEWDELNARTTRLRQQLHSDSE